MAEPTDALSIRCETDADHDQIARIVAAAFGSSVEAALVDRIRASPEYEPSMALVAEHEGEIVGHVMISGARLHHSDGERSIALLSPLAVAPARHKSGIGAALVEAVVAVADQRGEPMVVLEGDPRYYGRMGFEPSVGYGITMPLPDWAPKEAAQVRRLTAYESDDPTLRGEVSYPNAFDGVD